MIEHNVVTFADYILHHAKTRPHDIAIISSDRIATYGLLAEGIGIVQGKIAELNLRAGALVCIAGLPAIRHVIVAAALFRAGHPVLNVARAGVVRSLAFPIEAIFQSEDDRLIAGQRQILCSDKWFNETQRTSTEIELNGFRDYSEICSVHLSSGTTGSPKALSSSLATVGQWTESYHFSLGYRPWSRLLLMVGLSTNWGFTTAEHCLSLGRTLIFAADAASAIAKIKLYDIDLAVVSTLQLRDLVREQVLTPTSLASLRHVVYGGSLGSATLIEEARERLCTSIFCLYGSSEAGITAWAPTEVLTDEGAVGFVAPWAQVEIVDENDRCLAPDAEGTIRIRAPAMAQTYPDIAAGHAAGFRNGWFYPGDIGRLRSDGLLSLVGRSADVINVGGVKMAPDKIEDVLSRHPAVQEVGVFGIAGAEGVDEIAVAVVAKPNFDVGQLVAFGAENSIRVSRVFLVEALPKSTLGKIMREQLKTSLLG